MLPMQPIAMMENVARHRLKPEGAMVSHGPYRNFKKLPALEVRLFMEGHCLKEFTTFSCLKCLFLGSNDKIWREIKQDRLLFLPCCMLWDTVASSHS